MQDDRIGEIDKRGFAYRDLIGQDRWEASWIPTLSAAKWGDAGTPVVTTRYRIVGRQCFFQFRIVPGTSIVTTAGTTYASLPLTAKGLAGAAIMYNLTTNIAVGVCAIDVTNSRVYPPTQAASANTFLIAGWCEV